MPSTATPTPATNTHALRSSRPLPLYIQPTAHQAALKKQHINWTYEMEEAMVNGPVEAVWKGLRADSLYKKEGWQIALNAAQAKTQYLITIQQLKSKHNNHKKD